MSNIDTSSWQEFKLKDLFEASNGDTDIKKSDLDGQGLPVVTSGVANYGIAGRSSVVAREFDANTITVDMFGNVMYRSEPYKMVTHARVFSLALKDEYSMSEQVGLYLVGVLSKLTGGYGFNDMCSWSKICDKSILLPAMTVDEPDWDYMAERIAELEAERIAELEAERIAELEAYLVATGLDDCELTDEDREVLGRDVETKEFRIGDLFEKLKAPYHGNGRKQDNVSRVRTEEFSLPLVNCKNGDNGVMYYGRDDDFVWYENVLSVIYNGPPTEGQTYFQDKIGLYTDAYLLRLRDGRSMTRKEGLYLTALMNAAIHNEKHRLYSRGNKATWDGKVENDILIVPVTSAGTPDWDYMRAYIRAQEKLVMAGVADMTQERIDAMREIVEA